MREPVSILAGIEQAPFMLFRHFFSVALYSIWVLFTHPRRVGTLQDGKPVFRRPRPDEWPLLAIKSVQVVSRVLPPFFLLSRNRDSLRLSLFAGLASSFPASIYSCVLHIAIADSSLLSCAQFYTACVVFLPLLWTEVRP